MTLLSQRRLSETRGPLRRPAGWQTPAGHSPNTGRHGRLRAILLLAWVRGNKCNQFKERCMKRVLAVCAFATLPGLVQAQSAPVSPTPPTVARKPFVVKGPADRNDEYYWLRDDTRKNPDMLAYLKAENAYADAMLAPTKPLQDRLYWRSSAASSRTMLASPCANAAIIITRASRRRRLSDLRPRKGSHERARGR